MKLSIFVLILIELMIIAYVDIKTHKISNWWPFINIIQALLCYFILQDTYNWTWEIFLFPLGFVVLGFLMFLVNIMGAGDSKYLASLFLLIPIDLHFQFFEKLLISTIVVGAFMMILKLGTNFSRVKAFLLTGHWKGLREIFHSRLSYAPVMLLAWIVFGVKLWL